MRSGTLYLVPTPIGNLQDITYRAVTLLKEVDLILAEDTRNAGFLMKQYDISTQVRSFHAFNEHKAIDQVIQQLQTGKNIALVSDAGTPGISDPGFLLTRACHQHEIKVSCLPGATASIVALVASGLPCDEFFFNGFLPHKKGRMTRLKYLSDLPCTSIIYESPHRLMKCLEELATHCADDRSVAVCRELSKVYEDVRQLSLSEMINYYKINPTKIKGEIVIVLAGKRIV